MRHWSFSEWRLSDEQSGKLRDAGVPFGFIGSHPACIHRVDEDHVPPFVYFVCALPDHLEVWPLCAIAFPYWGMVNPGQVLVVGHRRIRIEPTEGPNDAAGIERQAKRKTRTAAKITMSWDGDSHLKTLKRPVTILGNDHPSTLRARDKGLRICDHAIVSPSPSEVWLVNLDPTMQGDVLDRVSCLTNESALTIGQLTLQLADADRTQPFSMPQTNSSTPQKNAASPPDQNPNVVRPVQEISTPGQETSMPARESAVPVQPIEQENQNPALGISSSHDLRSEERPAAQPAPTFPSIRTRSPARQADESPLQAKRAAKKTVDRSVADELAHELTDRLIELERKKTLRNKLILKIVYITVFAISICVLVWLIMDVFMPILQDVGVESAGESEPPAAPGP